MKINFLTLSQLNKIVANSLKVALTIQIKYYPVS